MNILRKGSRILFQGDSITNCFRKPDELNDAYQLGSGYPLLIASRLLATRPDAGLIFLNRGVSGNGIDELAARWDRDATALEPDIISLLIGVNETLNRTFEITTSGAVRPGNDNFAGRYRTLLQNSLEAAPRTQFILCEPFLLSTGDVSVAMKSHVARTADDVRRLAVEMKSIFVPLQQRFDTVSQETGPEYWAYDGIHPTAAGHWLIAEAWLEAVLGVSSAASLRNRTMAV